MVDTVGEYRVREIAREAAEQTVKQVFERLGIDNIAESRGDFDHLRKLVKASEARAQEGRRTVFTIIGGVILAVFGYVIAAFSLKGHP